MFFHIASAWVSRFANKPALNFGALNFEILASCHGHCSLLEQNQASSDVIRSLANSSSQPLILRIGSKKRFVRQCSRNNQGLPKRSIRAGQIVPQIHVLVIFSTFDSPIRNINVKGDLSWLLNVDATGGANL